MKENDICFRCCLSMQHFAKDCNVNIKCKQCNSEKHTTALHPGPAPWVTEPPGGESQHGKEKEEATSTDIVSKCTEICGNLTKPRSCSKICLVTVQYILVTNLKIFEDVCSTEQSIISQIKVFLMFSASQENHFHIP